MVSYWSLLFGLVMLLIVVNYAGGRQVVIIDHLHNDQVYNVSGICMYVCLSVCCMITFKSLDVRSFFCARPVYLEGIWVKFVYEDNQVELTVTVTNKVQGPYFRNVKL